MAKKMVYMSEAKFAKLVSKIKSFENKNGPISIGTKSLTNYLISNSETTDTKDEPVSTRTKRIILQIAGDYDTDPNDLKGSIKLAANLKYGKDEYALLQSRLDKLVKEYKSSASVTKKEANDCEKVSDCTKMVETKTKK